MFTKTSRRGEKKNLFEDTQIEGSKKVEKAKTRKGRRRLQAQWALHYLPPVGLKSG